MKKKLFSFILFIFFSFNSAVFSIEYQTSSKLRSLIKNESLNINQLIEMSFNYRNEPYGRFHRELKRLIGRLFLSLTVPTIQERK